MAPAAQPTSVWDTEDSQFGPPTPFTATVAEAAFVTDASYQDGEVYMLEMVLSDIDSSDPEWKDKEHTERYPVGKGWESDDRGKTVEHPQGKEKFHGQTFYGRIIAAVVGKDAGYENTLDELAGELGKRGAPNQAAIWEGLRLTFDRCDFDFGGEIGVKSRTMPVAVDGGTKASKGSKSKAKASGGDDAPTKREVTKALIEIAGECDDFDEFLERALSETEVEQFDKLLAQVKDEDEFWAEHGE